MAFTPVSLLDSYEQQGQVIEQRKLADLQQQQVRQGLLAKLQEAQRQEQLRQALAASGGDVEAAMKASIASGDLAGASKLAPIIAAQRPRAAASQPELLNLQGVLEKLPEGHPFRAQIESRIKMITERAPPNPAAERPYYSPVQTADGVRAFNARTGQIEQPKTNVVGAAADPKLQQQLSAGKAAGTEYGQEGAKAVLALPKVADMTVHASGLIDRMVGSRDGKVKAHPGFQSYIGMTLRPGAAFVDGTKEANFKAILDQVTGGAFLQAFETLKGGGQITVIEGEKATAAITRMRKSQSEEEFKEAARDFQEILQKGLQRARTRSTVGPQPTGAAAAPAQPSAPQPAVEALRKKSKSGKPIISTDGGKTWVYE